MKAFFQKCRALLPTKRRLIQLYCALLFNANLKGFVTGRIYQGPLKGICTPGLNCYSCPGASGACPLGSLQNAFSASNKRTPYYIFGILLLYGLLFGRFICGFLCPFGFIQELLHKIKTPKLKKSRVTRWLSYLKYVILVFFVVIVPILYAVRHLPLPAFCKYICPAGTLEGAIGLLSHKINAGELARLGPLFTWKFCLLVSFILGSIFIFRFFCRFFCPLGAIYGIFNRFSLFGIKLVKPQCTDCGLCVAKCKMDIRHVNDHECISCGECISVCPTNAIQWKGANIILPPSELEACATEEEKKAVAEKRNRRTRLAQIVAGLLMTALLASMLLYFNVFHKNPALPDTGSAVGEMCYGYDVQLYGEDGLTNATFNPAYNTGRITVINFWGTWCPGCMAELPYFDRIASEYKNQVTVLAIHTHDDHETAPAYIAEHYPDSEILFGKDVPIDESNQFSAEYYYTMLGGSGAYPITVILDAEGVIIASIMEEVTYEQLRDIIETELNGNE